MAFPTTPRNLDLLGARVEEKNSPYLALYTWRAQWAAFTCYTKSASVPLNSFRQKPHIEALQQPNPKVTKAQSEKASGENNSYSFLLYGSRNKL